jgi:uncharacterized protein (DUF983 family)
MAELKFTRQWCELCERWTVICPKCGNNCCNGGHGEVAGEPCDVCGLAHQHQDALDLLTDAYGMMNSHGFDEWAKEASVLLG